MAERIKSVKANTSTAHKPSQSTLGCPERTAEEPPEKAHTTTILRSVEVRRAGPDLTSRACIALLSAPADKLGLTEGLTATLRTHSRKEYASA